MTDKETIIISIFPHLRSLKINLGKEKTDTQERGTEGEMADMDGEGGEGWKQVFPEGTREI